MQDGFNIRRLMLLFLEEGQAIVDRIISYFQGGMGEL